MLIKGDYWQIMLVESS